MFLQDILLPSLFEPTSIPVSRSMGYPEGTAEAATTEDWQRHEIRRKNHFRLNLLLNLVQEPPERAMDVISRPPRAAQKRIYYDK